MLAVVSYLTLQMEYVLHRNWQHNTPNVKPASTICCYTAVFLCTAGSHSVCGEAWCCCQVQPSNAAAAAVTQALCWALQRQHPLQHPGEASAWKAQLVCSVSPWRAGAQLYCLAGPSSMHNGSAAKHCSQACAYDGRHGALFCLQGQNNHSSC